MMWKYLTIIFLATWKFMFTPIAGRATGLSYFETILFVLIGAYLAAFVFYFGSNYFIRRSVKKRIQKMQRAQQQGKKVPKKKIFTKMNRRIVFLKHRVNKYFIYWAFPLFLSIPGGCIIVAKFYKHHKQTFPMILFFLTVDCVAITSGVYLFNV